MGCDDEWARRMDKKEEEEKNKEPGAVWPEGEEKYLRFSRVPNKATVLRQEYIKKKYNTQKDDEEEKEEEEEKKKRKKNNKTTKKKKDPCLKKIEEKTIIMEQKLAKKKEKKEKKNRKRRQAQREEDAAECEAMKKAQKPPTRKPKKAVRMDKLQEPFKQKLKHLVRMLGHQVLLNQPSKMVLFMAKELEERLELRVCFEDGLATDEEKEKKDVKHAWCECVRCGDFALLEARKSPAPSKEPADCKKMKEVLQSMEEQCTCCIDTSPEVDEVDWQEDQPDSVEIVSDSLADPFESDKLDSYRMDSAADSNTKDEEDELVCEEDWDAVEAVTKGAEEFDEVDVVEEEEIEKR